MSIKIDKSLILSKIKSEKKFKSDAEFARFLGIKPQTLASWHSRNTFDIELIYAKCNYLNPHWLLTGEGEMLNNGNIINNVNSDNNINIQGKGNKSRVNNANSELLELIKKKDEQIAEKDKQIESLLEIIKNK